MTWSYDAIADVYATDMGASMPFDDVGWYARFCRARGGRVLELGCGSGRILVELLAGAIDAIGVDRSLPMLRRLRKDAAARGIDARVAQMDLRALALDVRFDTILAPYSLVTYLTRADELARVVAACRALLVAGGALVLDAFVPQPVVAYEGFRLDYRRAHGDGVLERSKRITPLGDGCNRIQRHYRLDDADGRTLEDFHTDETIRPYAEADLVACGLAAGFLHEATVHDYATPGDAPSPRFATMVLRAA